MTVLGIHALELHARTDAAACEALMTDEVFPAAAEAPGTVNRGGATFPAAVEPLRGQSL